MRGKTRILLILLLYLAGVSSAPAQNTLTLGKVSHNPSKHYRYLKPMVDFMARTCLPGAEGKVLMARDKHQLLQMFRQGRIDWVTETTFAAALLTIEAQAIPLALKWKKGQADYHSVIFSRKDAGIQKLQDLQGKTIALEDPASSSAYYIPMRMLQDAGLKTVLLSSPHTEPPEDAVGYLYAGEEVNISIWVDKGLADAGAFNNHDWNKPDHMPPSLRQHMSILARSETYPRAFELVSPKLPVDVRNCLQETLLGAHNNPDMSRILHQYQLTSRFSPITPETKAVFQRAHDTMQQVNRASQQ